MFHNTQERERGKIELFKMKTILLNTKAFVSEMCAERALLCLLFSSPPQNLPFSSSISS